jgi:hypothetical protein
MPSNMGRKHDPDRRLLGVFFFLSIASLGYGGQPRRADKPHLLVALGDSLGQGTMDGVNNYIDTNHAFVELVAEALATHDRLIFHQPLFDEDQKRLQPFLIPTNLSVDGSDSFSLEGLEYYKRAGVDESFVSTSLLSDHVLPRSLKDKYDKVLYPLNLLNRGPISQLDGAIWLVNNVGGALRLDDAIVLLWIGNNDSSTAALGFGSANPEFQPIPLDVVAPELKPLVRILLRYGERTGQVSFEPYSAAAIDRNMTNLDDFAAQYDHVVGHLLAETSASGVRQRVFVMTLPYYSAVGYLMDSDDLEFYFRKIDPAYTVPPSFKRVADPGQPITDPFRGDRISLLTFGLMYALLDSGYSSDYVNQVLEVGGQQRDGLVLSEDEQRVIRDRIDGFNDVIRMMPTSYGPDVHLVDVGQTLNDLLSGKTEIIIGGRRFDRKWSRGGGFSLDGVHPGYTGQAIIANLVLSGIDDALGEQTSPYDLEQIALTDPYIDRDGDGWVPGPGYKPVGMTQLLFMLTDADDSNPSVGAVLPDDPWTLISDLLLQRILGIPAIRAEANRLRAGR